VGQHGRIAEGLFERTGQNLDRLDHVRLEDHLVMVGAEFPCDDAGVVRLVEVVLRKANAEGLDGAGTGAGHHGDDGGRIDSTAQESAQRDVGDEADTRSLEQTVL
jgi:hypothetical protein